MARYGNIAGTGTASPTTLANPTAYALMAQYLNLPSFCDYIITNYYAGNWDWDWHNYSAVYNTAAETGFVFQDWDGERQIFSGSEQRPTSTVPPDTVGGPTQLFVQLLANADFRQMFADHVYKDLTTACRRPARPPCTRPWANTISQAVHRRVGPLGQLVSRRHPE